MFVAIVVRMVKNQHLGYVQCPKFTGEHPTRELEHVYMLPNALLLLAGDISHPHIFFPTSFPPLLRASSNSSLWNVSFDTEVRLALLTDERPDLT